MSTEVRIDLAGRRQLRVSSYTVEDAEGNELDRRILIAKAWQDDVHAGAPALFIPADAVDAVAKALRRVAKGAP